MRTFGRYLVGTLLVVVLTVAGVALHVLRTGHATGRPPAADAIVVLGAAEYNGRPSSVYAARLDHAAQLFREGVAPRVIAIGGRLAGDEYTEGSAGSRLSRAAGDTRARADVGRRRERHAGLVARHGRRRWTRTAGTGSCWSPTPGTRLGRPAWRRIWACRSASRRSPQGPAVQPGVEARYIWRETVGLGFYLLVGGSSGAGSPVL